MEESVEQLVSFHHIQVQLQGGAPWGFTLKGGLEHGEPLIITKIEDGGKAAQCKKLRVGDELVNINGSVLYGSRQEALILIKGSYRILKMAVRRRSFPVIRPHSWHLAKLSEPSSTAAPDAPPAMQLHSVPFGVPWHSGGDNSDLSMQWSQLTQHCSTDRSSSLGSMESLDPPSQGYYESQLSPVDPAIFNNKRDSAYSSFSASSNASDYTVSLRPDEASSMDSLLHGLSRCAQSQSAAAAEEETAAAAAKSRSLPRLPEAWARPASFACEEEEEEEGEEARVGGGGGPPRPPARRDSFRATRGRRPAGLADDTRRASAPVDVPRGCRSVGGEGPGGERGTACPCERRGGAGYAACGEGNNNDGPDQYYTLSSQLEPCRDCSGRTRGREEEEEEEEEEAATAVGMAAPSESGCPPASSPRPPKNPGGGHRHSAPAKLLSEQLLELELSGGRAEDGPQWTGPPRRPAETPGSPRAASEAPPGGRWDGTGCSAPPGSAAISEAEEREAEAEAATRPPVSRSWGRSISAPGGSPPPAGRPLSGAAPDPSAPPFDGLAADAEASPGDAVARLGAGGGGAGGGEAPPPEPPRPKTGSSRQQRSSKSRRRSERFATNLRNEIQRKKAQLQRSGAAGGPETVQEEEAAEITAPETRARLAPPAQPSQPAPPSRTCAYRSPSPSPTPTAPGPLNRLVSNSTPQLHHRGTSREDGMRDPRRPGSGGITSADDPGAAGRWRWTPERKPEAESERRGGARAAAGAGSAATLGHPARPPHGTYASASPRSSRQDECDILPFADRRRFFEETSRSLSVSNLPGLTSRRQRRVPGPAPGPAHTGAPALEPGRRRYSYQGFSRQAVAPRDQEAEPRRTSVSGGGAVRIGVVVDPDPEPPRCRPPPTDRDDAVLPSRNYGQCPYGRRDDDGDRAPRSAFHPVAPAAVPASQESRRPSLGHERRSLIPNDAGTVREREQTKLNRKSSLTERDYTWCRGDLRPADGAVQQGYRATDPRPSEGPSPRSAEEHHHQTAWYPPRGRALSESDVRLDPRGGPRARSGAATAFVTPAALSELEESAAAAPRKKAPPPPRPPPPDWEQFHRRRKSCHSLLLLSSSHQNLLSASAAAPPPPGETPPAARHPGFPPPPPRPEEEGSSSSSSLRLRAPELLTTPPRPRSHSLPPPREPPESRRPEERGPAFASGAFRPVAPPLPEYDPPPQRAALPTSPSVPRPASGPTDRETGAAAAGRPAGPTPDPSAQRATAGWEGQSLPSGGARAGTLPPRSYFSVSCTQRREAEEREPYRARGAGEAANGPFETDIDEFRDGEAEEEEEEEEEEEGREPVATETQCFARPVTVLETDMDTLPESSGPPPPPPPPPALSPEESGCSTRADLTGEPFPHGAAEGEAGGETWRGGNSTLELSVNTLERRSRQDARSGVRGQGSYCTSAAAKAELLNRMRELPRMNIREDDEELCYKRQLMESLRKKLGVLREAQRGLQDDVRANGRLGEEVEALVLAFCKPNEVDKFRMFVGDLDKVVSLLLSLSGRLLRVESALECLGAGGDSAHHERLPLLEKKRLLQGQLGEAQELKDHVDRREQAVCRVLSRCLTQEQLRDYSHYVKMKAALLVEQRQLEDKIRLGEEQLRALRESLGGQGQGAAAMATVSTAAPPVGLGYGHY